MAEAEREAAWRDVARKLAHEFRNILTPAAALAAHAASARAEEVPEGERAAGAREPRRRCWPRWTSWRGWRTSSRSTRACPSPASSGSTSRRWPARRRRARCARVWRVACAAAARRAGAGRPPCCWRGPRTTWCSTRARPARPAAIVEVAARREQGRARGSRCSTAAAACSAAVAGRVFEPYVSTKQPRQRPGALAGAGHRAAARRVGHAGGPRRRRRVRTAGAAAGRGGGDRRDERGGAVAGPGGGRRSAPIRGALRGALEDAGHEVTEAGDGAARRSSARRAAPPDVVLLDINMPGPRRARRPARASASTAPGHRASSWSPARPRWPTRCSAGQRGAYDFVEKPVGPRRTCSASCAEAGRVARLRRAPRAAAPPGPARRRRRPSAWWGSSPALQALLEQVRRVAPSQGRVLITGENGAGKELVARAIHALSKRADGPVRQAQLRGDPAGPARERAVRLRARRVHRRGAEQEGPARAGRRRHAVPRRDRRPVARGAGQAAARHRDRARSSASAARAPRRVDVRIVAATNKDLAAARRGRATSAQDLYYRLNVLPLHVPPLRERRGDIAAAGRALPRRVLPRRGAAAQAPAPTRRAPCSRTTTGPATCASCAT